MTPTPRQRARSRWAAAPRIARWLSWVSLSACAGLPEFTPGVTHRRDVLLALGEPVLALDQDRVLVHVWGPSTQLLMLPAHAIYRSEAGVLRRLMVALPKSSPKGASRPGGRPLRDHVVHEFDAQGLLLRRLP